jgi:hypothetical protein
MIQFLRDRNGKMIGQLKTQGDLIWLLNRNGIMQGRYNTKTDFTYDRNGKMVGRGNLVVTLLQN